MNHSYNFQSNIEPSDKELKDLMHDVLEDVKLRAKIASQKFAALQAEQIKEVAKKYRQLKLENAKI